MRIIKEHTLQKLKYFEKYLEAYLSATKRLPKKYYIDAFAGSGECILKGSKKIILGSPIIALKAKNSFSGYILIEKDLNNFNCLKNTVNKEGITEERLASIEWHNKDCNKWLKENYTSGSPNIGFLIFLDPEGPELLWETIISLSKLEKADLLILYPYDMALVRLIKNYKEKLDKFYGTEKWLEIYKNRKDAKDAKEKSLKFYMDNLKILGFKFVVYRQIRRGFREGKPLYHLILATHHPVGAKIMAQIFDKELDGQSRLKL